MKNVRRFVIPGLILGLSLAFNSCWNPPDKTMPAVTTLTVFDITSSSAVGGGNVTDNGNADILSRGLVWSKNTNPTLETNSGFSVSGSGVGVFQTQIDNLESGTPYYVKAYVVNEVGTAYGDEESFTTVAR